MIWASSVAEGPYAFRGLLPVRRKEEKKSRKRGEKKRAAARRENKEHADKRGEMGHDVPYLLLF